MAGFHNPYMKGLDFGQGMSDLSNNILQWMLLSKMMGGEGGGGEAQTQLGPTPVPQMAGMGRGQAQNLINNTPGAVAGGLDPNMMIQLMRLLGRY